MIQNGRICGNLLEELMCRKQMIEASQYMCGFRIGYPSVGFSVVLVPSQTFSIFIRSNQKFFNFSSSQKLCVCYSCPQELVRAPQ